MTLLLLEALGAGLILVGIVWWTMFAGRTRGELPPEAHRTLADNADKTSAQDQAQAVESPTSTDKGLD